MQNDFVDGVLGTPEAAAIVPNVVEKINGWDGDIIATRDTHEANYMETREGKFLPVSHCIEGKYGHLICDDVKSALYNKGEKGVKVTVLNKRTFGSTALPELIRMEGYEYIELVGLCTGICVVSNAMLLKANFPETDIAESANVCAVCRFSVQQWTSGEYLQSVRGLDRIFHTIR